MRGRESGHKIISHQVQPYILMNVELGGSCLFIYLLRVHIDMKRQEQKLIKSIDFMIFAFLLLHYCVGYHNSQGSEGRRLEINCMKSPPLSDTRNNNEVTEISLTAYPCGYSCFLL